MKGHHNNAFLSKDNHLYNTIEKQIQEFLIDRNSILQTFCIIVRPTMAAGICKIKIPFSLLAPEVIRFLQLLRHNSNDKTTLRFTSRAGTGLNFRKSFGKPSR